MKTSKEILASIRELTHRHWKRWLKAQSKIVDVCKHARSPQSRCSNCNPIPGSPCAVPESFELVATEKLRLKESFSDDINNPAKLIRDYRDVAMLLWVLGLLDERDTTIPVEERVVDEALRLASEAVKPTELKIAMNFPVGADGYINLGNGNRIEATAFVAAMKQFQEKKPEKVVLVHERVQAASEGQLVVGHPEAGPQNGGAVPEARSPRPKLLPHRGDLKDDSRPKVGTDSAPHRAKS